MKSILIILIFYVSTVWKYSYGDSVVTNSLRTTWGRDPTSGNAFVPQPLTIKDAEASGFKRIQGRCQGKFLGHRYILNNDVSLILIYNNEGIIAGIQMAIPISIVTEFYNFKKQKMFNRDRICGIDVYILTTYFIDPKSICRSNRKEKCQSSGIWFQNGKDPIRDSFFVSINENQLNSTKWVQGQCFPTMGMHYWYDNRLDSDCQVYFPTFLMYNQGRLSAFSFGLPGLYTYSNRTEYPPLAVLSLFMKPVPLCIPQFYNQTGGFTSMHVFFHPEPWKITC